MILKKHIKRISADNMIADDIEEILIEAVHSSKVAENYLKNHVCEGKLLFQLLDIVQNSESGDARMSAAYWLSQYDAKYLKEIEKQLIELTDEEWDSVTVHIFVALSKMKSKKGLEILIEKRIKPKLYWEAKALKYYFE